MLELKCLNIKLKFYLTGNFALAIEHLHYLRFFKETVIITIIIINLLKNVCIQIIYFLIIVPLCSILHILVHQNHPNRTVLK